MIAALWVAMLSVGSTGFDTRHTFPTEQACQVFVDTAYAKSKDKRGMSTIVGVCVRSR